MEQVRAICGVVEVRPGDLIPSFLPSAHIADRVTTHHFGMLCGVQVTYVADAKAIGAALTDTHPTILFAVPRVWEKVELALETKVDAEPDPERQAVLRRALQVVQERAGADLAGSRPSELLDTEHAQVDAAVLAPLRAALGLDRVRWAWSGAADIEEGNQRLSRVERVKGFEVLPPTGSRVGTS